MTTAWRHRYKDLVVYGIGVPVAVGDCQVGDCCIGSVGRYPIQVLATFCAMAAVMRPAKINFSSLHGGKGSAITVLMSAVGNGIKTLSAAISAIVIATRHDKKSCLV